jgi:vitamin K-dependent gamma-carboxylase-like protein
MNRFDAFWFADEPVENLTMARILLALTALWVVLSRAGLPSVLQFPRELWETVPLERRLRFLLVGSFAVERLLWAVLHVSLLAAMMGWVTRWSCLASGLLLYHFAPLETIIWTPNPYLRGLTIPCLGLLFFAFADATGGASKTAVRPVLPLRLTQTVFCSIYFFAGYAKLFWSGLAWMQGRNMRLYLLGLDQFLGLHTPVALRLAEWDGLCTAIAVSGLVFEIIFPIVLFVPASRRFFIPAAVFFHVANSMLFHVFFHDIALLLLFANWHWAFERCRALMSRSRWAGRSFET